MIIDRLKNASLYFDLHKRLKAAFNYLQNTDFSELEPGRYEVEGTNIYALVQQYESKPKEKGRWEAHRRYMDIQYIWEGEELFGHAYLDDLNIISYDENKDFVTLEGKGDFVTLHSGSFVIVAPQDAHMPGIAVSTPKPVKKIVVKVLI